MYNKTSKKHMESKSSSTFNHKLRIGEFNGQYNSNYASWITDMQDTISKFGELYKKRFMTRRFSSLSEAKLRNKYSYDVETPVNSDTWRAKTIRTDQITINNIEDDSEREIRSYELFDVWCSAILKANAIIAADNVIKKSYLERIGTRVLEDKDTNTAIFATVSQYLDQDSKDMIRSHIIKDYGKPYRTQISMMDDLNEEASIHDEDEESNNGEYEVDSNESILSRPAIADTDYHRAELIGDWVWLLIAAEETHVARLIEHDQDDQEEVQDREDLKLRSMKCRPGGSLAQYNRLFKIQIEVCARVKRTYSQSTLMRLYMKSMPDDLFVHKKREYDNPLLRAN
jgi:hypothetical protein